MKRLLTHILYDASQGHHVLPMHVHIMHKKNLISSRYIAQYGCHSPKYYITYTMTWRLLIMLPAIRHSPVATTAPQMWMRFNST